MDDALDRLAQLLGDRNRIDAEIARLIGRPALIGHIGEWIAARVFDLDLEPAANAPGIDGRFRCGPLAGKTVNVKCYGKQEGLLDIRPDALPDYYLVLCGPRARTMTSRNGTRPFAIESVYLFGARDLVEALRSSPRPPKLGVATSVRRQLWEAARILPRRAGAVLVLTDAQEASLSAFC